MTLRRRRHGDEFKAKVALEAVRGVRTLREVSATHPVHPTGIALFLHHAQTWVFTRHLFHPRTRRPAGPSRARNVVSRLRSALPASLGSFAGRALVRSKDPQLALDAGGGPV